MLKVVIMDVLSGDETFADCVVVCWDWNLKSRLGG